MTRRASLEAPACTSRGRVKCTRPRREGVQQDRTRRYSSRAAVSRGRFLHVECPCCGAEEVQLEWLTARNSDYSRRVCGDCRADALSGERRVWAFYWHDTPDIDDDVTWQAADEPQPDPADDFVRHVPRTWRPDRSSDAPYDRRQASRAEASEWDRAKRPGSSSESHAELVARREQLLAASRGETGRPPGKTAADQPNPQVGLPHRRSTARSSGFRVG